MSYKLVKVLLLRNLTEDDCRVMTTETKGVAQCHADITLTRSVERKVEVGRNCGVEVLDIAVSISFISSKISNFSCFIFSKSCCFIR